MKSGMYVHAQPQVPPTKVHLFKDLSKGIKAEELELNIFKVSYFTKLTPLLVILWAIKPKQQNLKLCKSVKIFLVIKLGRL